MRSKLEEVSKDELLRLINESSSIRDILIKVGYKNTGTYLYNIFNELLIKYNIDKPKYENLNRKTNWRRYEMSDILVEDSRYRNRNTLKNKLIKNSLLEYKCSCCGNNGEWMGKSITLHLEHKNGKNNDNRLENLEFLCPNCHSQTSTYCGRNIIYEKIENKCECGEKIEKNKKKCRKCVIMDIKEKNKKNRKIKERPVIEDILKNIEDHGYSKTGRIYGVSDNTIRKWIKWNEN